MFLHSEDEEGLEDEEGIGNNSMNFSCQMHFISLYVYILFYEMLYRKLTFPLHLKLYNFNTTTIKIYPFPKKQRLKKNKKKDLDAIYLST
jgi:hypothetical protein